VRIVALVAGFTCAFVVVVPAFANDPRFEETRIPHRDGSGRATVVEIDPAVPGAREFIRGEERPAPGRGEVSLPSPTSEATPRGLRSVAPQP
jgi:hypothetical protein